MLSIIIKTSFWSYLSNNSKPWNSPDIYMQTCILRPTNQISWNWIQALAKLKRGGRKQNGGGFCPETFCLNQMLLLTRIRNSKENSSGRYATSVQLFMPITERKPRSGQLRFVCVKVYWHDNFDLPAQHLHRPLSQLQGMRFTMFPRVMFGKLNCLDSSSWLSKLRRWFSKPSCIAAS